MKLTDELLTTFIGFEAEPLYKVKNNYSKNGELSSKTVYIPKYSDDDRITLADIAIFLYKLSFKGNLKSLIKIANFASDGAVREIAIGVIFIKATKSKKRWNPKKLAKFDFRKFSINPDYWVEYRDKIVAEIPQDIQNRIIKYEGEFAFELRCLIESGL